MEYTEWHNFLKVIKKAKETCKNSKYHVSDHFVDVNKMVDLGSGAKREVDGKYREKLWFKNEETGEEHWAQINSVKKFM